MTADFKSRLAVLRRRITRIERKPRDLRPVMAGVDPELGESGVEGGENQVWHPEPFVPVCYEAEEFIPGEVVENEKGRYFLAEKFFPAHRSHGSVEFSRLAELSPDLLQAASSGDWPNCGPERWA